jgi:hypothetical protein
MKRYGTSGGIVCVCVCVCASQPDRLFAAQKGGRPSTTRPLLALASSPPTPLDRPGSCKLTHDRESDNIHTHTQSISRGVRSCCCPFQSPPSSTVDRSINQFALFDKQTYATRTHPHRGRRRRAAHPQPKHHRGAPPPRASAGAAPATATATATAASHTVAAAHPRPSPTRRGSATAAAAAGLPTPPILSISP